MSYLGLIVKATRLCNLRCSYCHDWRAEDSQVMSFEVLSNLVARALSDPWHSAVDFIWHGGEPTLLPLSFFEKALYLQARFRREGQTVQNILQTNATRLSDEWIEFFRGNQFGLGISLDGPVEIHDQYRVTSSGRPTFELVRGAIERLLSLGIPFTVLMVIDDETLALGADYIFDFFLELGVKRFSCIAAKPVNAPDAPANTPALHYASPVQMRAFHRRMYDRWLEHGDPEIYMREVNGIRQRIQHKRAGTCTLAGGCLGRYYLIEPNGDVAHCDLFLGDPSYTLGNVCHQGFADFRSGEALTTLQTANQAALEAMRSCPHFSVCNGWCPHERYLSARHNPDHTAACCGLGDLIEHIAAREGETHLVVAH